MSVYCRCASAQGSLAQHVYRQGDYFGVIPPFYLVGLRDATLVAKLGGKGLCLTSPYMYFLIFVETMSEGAVPHYSRERSKGKGGACAACATHWPGENNGAAVDAGPGLEVLHANALYKGLCKTAWKVDGDSVNSTCTLPTRISMP